MACTLSFFSCSRVNSFVAVGGSITQDKCWAQVRCGMEQVRLVPSSPSSMNMGLSVSAFSHREASRELLQIPADVEESTVTNTETCSFSVVQQGGNQFKDGTINVEAIVPSTSSANVTIVPRPVSLKPPVGLKLVGKSCDSNSRGGIPKTHVLSSGQCKVSIKNTVTCAAAGRALGFILPQRQNKLPVQFKKASITVLWPLTACTAGEIITWTSVRSDLVSVKRIYSTGQKDQSGAFAALRTDGTVVTWGLKSSAPWLSTVVPSHF